MAFWAGEGGSGSGGCGLRREVILVVQGLPGRSDVAFDGGRVVVCAGVVVAVAG
jgi:hypothetical protein